MLMFFHFFSEVLNSSVIKSNPGLSHDQMSPGDQSSKTNLPLYDHQSHPTISWELQQHLRKWQPEFLGHGLQIICSPNHARGFSALTLTVPCERNDLSLTGNLGNTLKGVPLIHGDFPQLHFWLCSHHTNWFCCCLYDSYQPHMMDRCQDKGVARSPLPWMGCQGPTVGTGQRTSGGGKTIAIAGDGPSQPPQPQAASGSSSSKDTSWTLGETTWVHITWSGTCQPLCHGEVKQPVANHSLFSRIKSEVHSLLLCTKSWPWKPAENLPWAAVAWLPLSPRVQSSCLSKVSRGMWDASSCTRHPHEAGAEMGHMWDLYPSRAASRGHLKLHQMPVFFMPQLKYILTL